MLRPRLRFGLRPLLVLPGLAVTIGLILPLVYLAVRAFEGDFDTVVSLVWRLRNLELLARTLLLAAAVVSVASLVAFPLAWLTVRTDLRFPMFWTVVGVLPLAVPGYVTAYILLGATGDYGAIARGFGVALPRVGGFTGSLWALSVYTFPYLFLHLRTALIGLNPSLEESARSLGHGPWNVIRSVVLPQLRPAWLSGSLLVALHVVGDFGVVSLMRYETLSYALFLQYTGAFDRVYAAWIALFLLALASVLIWSERRLLGAFHCAFRAASVRSRAVHRQTLGRARPMAYAFSGLLLIQGLILPVATLAYWIRGASIDWSDLLGALIHSVQASVPAAVIAVTLAVPIAYSAVRRTGRWFTLPERVAYFGYATPPLALALALIVFSLNMAPGIYQTVPLLVGAYSLHFLAEAVGPVRTSLLQLSPRIQEAGYALGRGPWDVFRNATLPSLRPGIVAGAAFVFLSAIKELPLTFLLSPIGFDTLAMNVWSYTSEAVYARAAPFSLIVIAFSAVFVGLLLSRENA